MPTQGHVSLLSINAHDISPYVTSVTATRNNDTLDTTTYGATGHTFVAGLTNGKLVVNCLWDKTAVVGSFTVFNAMIGAASVAFIWSPEGSTTGNVKITGNVIMDTYVESAPVADLVTAVATLQITGAVTSTVY